MDLGVSLCAPCSNPVPALPLLLMAWCCPTMFLSYASSVVDICWVQLTSHRRHLPVRAVTTDSRHSRLPLSPSHRSLSLYPYGFWARVSSVCEGSSSHTTATSPAACSRSVSRSGWVSRVRVSGMRVEGDGSRERGRDFGMRAHRVKPPLFILFLLFLYCICH